MKISIGILTLMLLSSAFVLTGCDRPGDKMQDAETSVIEANRDLEIATSEMEAELQIYRTENSERIMENNRTIGEIKQRISSETDSEVRSRHQTRIDRYEETNSELKREIDNYSVSDRDNWDNFTSSFDSRMSDLSNSLNNFFSTSRNN